MYAKNQIVSKSFGPNLELLQLFGIYLPKNHRKLSRIYAYAVHILLTGPVPILGVLHFILGEDVNMIEVANNMFTVAEMGCFIFKFFPLVHNPFKFQKYIHNLDSDRFERSCKIRHEQIITSCTQTCRRNFRVFFFVCVSSFGSWAIQPLLEHARVFPVEIWLPFEAAKSPLIFYTVYLLIVLLVFHATVITVSIDTLVAGLACQATGQVQILKDNLENLLEDTDEEISRIYGRDYDDSEEFFGLRSRVLYKNIASCIDHYDEILKFTKNYEEAFSAVVFSQFAASIFVICISCYQLLMVTPLSFDFFVIIVFIVAVLNEIFLFCYYGTALREESDGITRAIYMGKWYEYDVKSRKALILLMERAKKPINVRAGKYFALSLETFVTILRRAYSLLAVFENQ